MVKCGAGMKKSMNNLCINAEISKMMIRKRIAEVGHKEKWHQTQSSNLFDEKKSKTISATRGIRFSSMKKAIIESETVKIILAVTAAAVLLIIAYNLISGVSQESAVEQCRSSFLKAHVAKTASGDFLRTPISCTAENKKVSTDVQIADELRDCWYKTLGSANTIGKTKLFGLIDPLKKDYSFCLTCARITPENSISLSDVKGVLNQVSKRDSVSYVKFLENSHWDTSLDRFFLTFSSKVPDATKMTSAIVSGENPQVKYYSDDNSDLRKDVPYRVISQSYDGSPHVFIVEEKESNLLPCEVSHYQLAKGVES